MTTARFRLLALAGILALVLVACGGDDDEATPPPDEPATEETGDEDGTTEPATVETADSDLGTILVDGEGLSLYLFMNDTDGTSTCYDDCEANWPPLTVDGEPTGGAGVDASLLGTTERDDGSTQATYGGQPLYYFAGDQAAGDVNGQGVGDVWFAVTPEGEPAG